MEEEKLLKFYQMIDINQVYANHPGELLKDFKMKTTPKKASKNIEPNSICEKVRQIADNCHDLSSLRQAVENFKDLSITKTAQNVVFSDGNPKAKVMAIGEAPGANEDEQGIPFCGVSGQLLDKIFASINLDRQTNLYITNSVFWRPPGNRKPTSEEIEICLPFLEKHIALINPSLIILVGSTAAQAILQSSETISRLRGNFIEYNNSYLTKNIASVVVFHPSYLLRQPLQKKTVWYDMLSIQKKIADIGS